MIDLELLAKTYFWFDKPVPLTTQNGKTLMITPVSVEDSVMFVSWVDLLCIDKNSFPNPEYISMSYLDFIAKVLIQSDNVEIAKYTTTQLVSLLRLCLGWDKDIQLRYNERNKAVLSHEDCIINSKLFDDIKRIILYQNLIDYDDTYINPDVKQAINEVEELRHKNIVVPTLERKMAIITAHTGLSKEQQMKMTYRSHCLLFKEVYGEVDYLSVRTALMIGNMLSKKKVDIEDWIFKKQRSKYEQYFTSEDKYSASMGGQNSIHSNITSLDKTINLNSF